MSDRAERVNQDPAIYEVEDLGGEVIEPKKYDGLKGWCLIPGLLPVVWGWNFINGYIGAEGGEVEIVGFALVLIMLGVLSWPVKAFFAKSKHWPKAFVITFLTVWALDVFASAFVLNDSAEEVGRTVGRMIWPAIIWFSYLAKSKRVADTFTR